MSLPTKSLDYIYGIQNLVWHLKVSILWSSEMQRLPVFKLLNKQKDQYVCFGWVLESYIKVFSPSYFWSDLLRTNICLPDFIKEKGSRFVAYFCLYAGFLFYLVLCSCAAICSCGCSMSQPSSCLIPLQFLCTFHATNGAAIFIWSGAHRYCIDKYHCSYEQIVPRRLFLLLTCELKEL